MPSWVTGSPAELSDRALTWAEGAFTVLSGSFIWSLCDLEQTPSFYTSDGWMNYWIPGTRSLGSHPLHSPVPSLVPGTQKTSLEVGLRGQRRTGERESGRERIQQPVEVASASFQLSSELRNK